MKQKKADEDSAHALQRTVQTVSIAAHGEGRRTSSGKRSQYACRTDFRLAGESSATRPGVQAQRLMQSEHAQLKRELTRLEGENAFQRKGGGIPREKPEVKYATMREHEGGFAI